MVNLTGRTQLHVTDQTSLRDLKNFTDSLKPNQSIRAVKQNGVTVLYAKDGKSSFGAKLFGVAERRRTRAQNTIKSLIENYATKTQGMLKEGEERIGPDLMSYSVKTGLFEGSSTMRGGETKAVVDLAYATYHTRATKLGEEPSVRHQKLHGLLGDMGKVVADKLADLMDAHNGISAERTKGWVELLHGSLQMIVGERLGGDPEAHKAFVLEKSPDLRRELTYAIRTNLVEKGYTEKSVILRIPEEVVSKAVAKLCSDLVSTTDGKVDSFKLGDTAFKKEREIGSGSFGSVFVFNGEQGEKIAVKTTASHGGSEIFVSELSNSKTNLAEEYVRHLSAQGQPPHENILQVKGFIQFEDGNSGVAMELAPHGNCEDLAERMTKYGESAGLTDQQKTLISLTVIKDMATGLKSMQDRGIVHGDLKTANAFIGEGGVIKLADFGTTQGGGRLVLRDSEDVQSPQFLSPETIRSKEDKSKVDDEISAKKENFKTNIRNVLATLYKGDQLEGLTDVATDEVLPHQHRDDLGGNEDTRSKISVGPSSDNWAVGVSLFQLLTGKNLLSGVRNFALQDALADFKSGVAIGPNGVLNKTSTGNDVLDTLINRLLDPNPETRMTMEQLLQHEYITDQSVGTPEIRNLMVGLKPVADLQDLADDIGKTVGEFEKFNLN